MARNLVAVYRDPRFADAAVRDLVDAGVPRDRIQLSHRQATGRDELRSRDREDRMSLVGGLIGALVGAVLFGFLAVILAFAGLDWILMDGGGATILGSAAVGALLGFVFGSLGLGIGGGGARREGRAGYQEESVVTVTSDHDVERVVMILARHDPLEIDRGTPEVVEPIAPAARRRGLLSDVELADRQTREPTGDRSEEPT